jgi:hypothetical protein
LPLYGFFFAPIRLLQHLLCPRHCGCHL